MTEINDEEYMLQGSNNGETWIDIQKIPRYYVTADMIESYCRRFILFRSVSLLTKEVLMKVKNVQKSSRRR